MGTISTDFDTYDRYENSTLVLVTDQINCERIIKKGFDIAKATKTNLYVVNIDNGKQRDAKAIEHLFKVSKDNGAVMNIFYNQDIFKTIEESIEEYNAVNVVTGMPQSHNSILTKLWSNIPAIDYYMVALSGDVTRISARKSSMAAAKVAE